MTVSELKNREDYEFECNIFKGTTITGINETNYFDEWGCAFIWLGEKIGVEYNLCIDNTTNETINCSAIYKVKLNEFMEADYNEFIHYEIDFDEHNWVESLENAMCKALIELFDL